MKAFNFNFNDYVLVTLSKEGAEHLSDKRKEFYDRLPTLKRGKDHWREGEIYKTQFWSLVNDFADALLIGHKSPFISGIIRVESSMED